MADSAQKVCIQQIENGRQAIVADGRFTLSWAIDTVSGLTRPQHRDFHNDTMELLYAMRLELSDLSLPDHEAQDNRRRAHEAQDNRRRAHEAFLGVCMLDGSSVTYDNRNTRYTSFGGMMLAEAIDTQLPMDAPDPYMSIPNPLNHPEIQV